MNLGAGRIVYQDLTRIDAAIADRSFFANAELLAACDAVLIASGTATLEALLCQRPMVVAYRVAPLTYRILKRLVSSAYISLPNLLAGRLLVPELIQDAATPEALAATLLPLLENGTTQTAEFAAIHRSLRLDASTQAAEAVLALIAGQPCS